MLLYNHNKEFIGIDEDDLSNLDFQNIAELQNESSDFADLFVKKPGYIHNFKNFSWIDFILHSESDESKAIIHAKGRNYSCLLHVATFHFTDSESGYVITIKNLRPLSGAEDAQANKDVAASEQSIPSAAAAAKPVQETPQPEISLEDVQSAPAQPQVDSEMELPHFEIENAHELSEPQPLEVPDALETDYSTVLEDRPAENEFGAPSSLDLNAPLDINADDLMLDTPLETSEPEVEPERFDLPEEITPKAEEAPMLGDYVSGQGSEYLSELVKSGSYRYDPSVAANELGLPVDLIEEFIGDFIEQAHQFHDELFSAVQAGDFDNVQILSHKLKGVAANLRVEDAFDVLSVVNTSKESEEILPNLNEFYRIIAKLEGKEVPEASPASQAPDVDETPESIDIKQPEDGPMLIDETMQISSDDDDLYADLLATPNTDVQQTDSYEQPLPPLEEDIYDDLLAGHEFSETVPQEEMQADLQEEQFPPLQEDIYDNLLATPDLTEVAPADEMLSEPAPIMDDDIYDDLLATPQENVESALEMTPEPKEEAPVPDLPALNFDAQRSANELGIPVEIVNEFVQEFKEQVRVHQNDFDNAIASGNVEEVNKTATLLKGMSDNLRLNEISEVLKGLQIEKDVNNTAQALASLQAYADQL